MEVTKATFLSTRFGFHIFFSSGTFVYLSLYAVNQAQVQRLLSVKSLGRAQAALWLQLAILIVLSGSMMVAGLVMYAYFRGCDPIQHGDIAQVRVIIKHISLVSYQCITHFPFSTGTLSSTKRPSKFMIQYTHTLDRPFQNNSHSNSSRI